MALSSAWYPETGAINHISPNLVTLSFANEYKGNNQLLVGNGKCLSIKHNRSSILVIDS